jgi:hypothetical protein
MQVPSFLYRSGKRSPLPLITVLAHSSNMSLGRINNYINSILKNSKAMNESENQLLELLDSLDGTWKQLRLIPQGDDTIIRKEAMNLCEVEAGGRTYTFGGISEKVYDYMVVNYHNKP